MKGKMKKIIAGIATLAMVAQFAFVIPASAATLYTQDYQSVADDAALKEIWTSPSYADGITLGKDGENKYAQFTVGNNNSRNAKSEFSVDLTGKSYYVVEFDMALTTSSGKDPNASQFVIMNGGSAPNNAAISSDYLFMLDMPATSTDIKINKLNNVTGTLTNSQWYKYKLIVDVAQKLVTVTITDGEDDTPIDKALVPINGAADKITGINFLSGRYNSVIKLDNFVVREKTDDDVIGEKTTETLASIEFTSQLNKVITAPEENAPVHDPITVKATGIYGSDITNAEGLDIKWTTKGLANEDSYISLTKDSVDALGTLGEYPDGDATAYFNVRNGVGNWFGNVTATVTYLGETMSISTPFAVLGAKETANIAPLAGYPENMSDYDDDLVGYISTTGGQKDKDIVLDNWTIFGSAGGRNFELKKDDDGTKYLQFHAGTNGSSIPTYQLANQSSQYIVDTKVRFTSGSITMGHYTDTPNDANRKKPLWEISYKDGALTVGTGSIKGLNQTDWFRIVVSADESVKTFWAKAYTADGTLLGTVEDQVLENVGEDQKFFSFSGALPFDLASFRIYNPAIATVDLNSTTETVSVPSSDSSPERELDEDGVFTYNVETKALAIDTKDTTVTKARLITAEYKDNALLTMKMSDEITFEGGKATVANYTAKEGAKLYLWDGFDTIKPVTTTVGTAQNMTEETEPVVDLSAILTSTEGFDMSAGVTWETDITDEAHVVFAADETDSHKATLTVKEGAPAGNVTITARSGAASAEKVINLTTTGNSIKFEKSVTSLTIPFSGESNAEGEFEAYTVDRKGNKTTKAVDADGNALEADSTTTYTVLNSRGQDITASMPAGITFTNGKLTVASDAKPAILTIKATNNDTPALSSNVKVNIHGLSFGFGSDEPADGLTQVQKDSYSDKIGYGFADASKVSVNAANVTGTDEYVFKAKVPNGNYVVDVDTTSATLKSEVIDNIPSVTSLSRDGQSRFTVAVCDGILDLTFAKGSELKSLSISQAEAKERRAKPAIYAIGDSTTNNTGNGAKSWGNCVADGDVTLPTVFSAFHNNGMAGRDSVQFYNEKRIENVLLEICPGDYVTVNMGINSRVAGEGSSYETVMSEYCVQAILDRGAIPVIVTATPDGATWSEGRASFSWGNNMSGTTFTNNRGTGARNGVLRKIAQNKELNIIELGYWGEAYFNSLTDTDVTAYNTEYGKSYTSVAEMVANWYVDHNHYYQYLGKKIGEYLLNSVADIEGGSDAFLYSNDAHINEQ